MESRQASARRHQESWTILHRTAYGLKCLLFPCLLASTSSPAGANLILLEPNPWHVRGYGLSLRPPIGVTRERWPTSDIRMRFLAHGYTIDLFIRKRQERERDDMILDPKLIGGPGADHFSWQIRPSEGELTLDRVQTIAIRHMAAADPTAIIDVDKSRDLELDGRPAAVIYFKISAAKFALRPEEKHLKPWVIGQAFVQVQPETFAVLRLKVNLDNFAKVQPIFEAVVHSVRFQDAQELAAARKARLDRGAMWRQLADDKAIRGKFVAEQWFRLLRNKKDIGYMQVLQRQATEMNLPGVQIQINARVKRGTHVYDSVSHFFLSDDTHHEFWSIRTAVRPLGLRGQIDAPVKSPKVAAWKETGARDQDIIHVKRESPQGVKDRHWKCPPEHYISQVELYVMGSLLPHQQRQEMAFYAYHPNTGHLLLRTVTVVPERDGAYRVHNRPGLDHPEDVAYYNAEGRLVRHELHGALLIQPATVTEMREVWNLP